MKTFVQLLSLLFCLEISTSQISELNTKWQMMCPGMYPYEYKGFTPRGNLSSGIFQEMAKLIDIEHCIASCCNRFNCNIILMNNNTCYHVMCKSNKLCIPKYRPDKANAYSPPSMVLVRPVENNGPWTDWINDNENAK